MSDVGAPADGVEWEHTADLSGFGAVCLGDPGAPGGNGPRTGTVAGWVWRNALGSGFVGGVAQAGEVAVATGRRLGRLVGAQVAFTPRIDELAEGEGRWVDHGRLRCLEVVVWDEERHPDPATTHRLPLGEGDYTAELFSFRGVALGLRLVAVG